MRRKNSSALQGRWLEEPEGFPIHVCHSARETKRPLWPLQGKQNGHNGHVGVSPPPPLRGSSPCEAGQFIPAGFDCRHSEVCKSRNPVSLNSLHSFFQIVLNPQECGLFPDISSTESPVIRAIMPAGKPAAFMLRAWLMPYSFHLHAATDFRIRKSARTFKDCVLTCCLRKQFLFGNSKKGPDFHATSEKITLFHVHIPLL